MRLVRRLTAPLSAIFLILVAGFAFVNLQAKSEIPPPILDPQFEIWVSDTDLGGSRPLVWQLEYAKGVGDQVTLEQSTSAGREALKIQIFQDGADEDWAYVYLRQTIDGARLRALCTMKLQVWVLEVPCECGGPVISQPTVFGLEIRDDTHALTFIFSPERSTSQQFLDERTVYLATSRGEWAHHEIDIAEEYAVAQWTFPQHLSLGIVLGAPGPSAGLHVGYVQRFAWTASPRAALAQAVDSVLSLSDVWSDPRGIGDHLSARANLSAEASSSQGFNE